MVSSSFSKKTGTAMNNAIRIIACCSFILCIQMEVFSVDEFDIEKEISSLRKELSDITSQRKNVKNDMIKDEKEFISYTMRTKKRFDILGNEIDSVENDIKKQVRINDSLSSTVETIKNSKHQIELLQNLFREKLINSCDTYLSIIKTYPPMVGKTLSASLSYLKSELAAKNIDNNEGIQRLVQVLKDIDEASASIQLVQGVSPVSEIRGTTYRVRFGLLFEAVVNLDGTAYAMWCGFEKDGNEKWETGSDVQIAEQLLKCINIREGKALPEFVQLPISQNQFKGEIQ